MELTALTIYFAGTSEPWRARCAAACAHWAADGIAATLIPLSDPQYQIPPPRATHPIVIILDEATLTEAMWQWLEQLHLLMPHLAFVVIADQVVSMTRGSGLFGGVAEMLFAWESTEHAVRQRIEAALQRNAVRATQFAQAERRFAQVIERSGDGVVVCDPLGLVHFVNPAAERLLDHPAEDLLGRILMIPYDLAQTSTWETEQRDGGRRLLDVHAVEMAWDEMPAILVTCHDVTDVRQLVQLQTQVVERDRLDQQNDAFVHMLAHELRSPLSIMQASLSNLLANVAGPVAVAQKKLLQITTKNIERMTRLLTSLLSLARLESGHTVTDWQPVDMATLCDEVQTSLQAAAGARGVSIAVAVETAAPDCSGDADLLTQLLTNILGNAVRYARSHITVTLADPPAETGDEQMLAVTIHDDGAGIPANDPMVVFEKFSQLARQSGSAEYKGTGLGLAICREIVERHRGSLWAANASAGGALFTIWLPRLSPATGAWKMVTEALEQARQGSAVGLVAVEIQDINTLRRRLGSAAVTRLLEAVMTDMCLSSLRREDSAVVDGTLGTVLCCIAAASDEVWAIGQRLQKRFSAWSAARPEVPVVWQLRVLMMDPAVQTVPQVLSHLLAPAVSTWEVR